MTLNIFKRNSHLALAMSLVAGTSAPLAYAEDSVDCGPKGYLMALRYQQQSAEIDALQIQTYKLAEERLKAMVIEHQGETDLALMTDLDETVIDNSPLLVRDMENCHDFSGWDTWKHWEREGNPELIPGAKQFLDLADELGVKIFYVSDRYDDNKGATIASLNTLELPQVNEDQVRLLGPSKADRRADIQKNYTLLMQLGDTLADFSGEFHHASMEKQHALVSQYADHFSNDWIMLPNASYGHWDEAELNAWNAPIEAE